MRVLVTGCSGYVGSHLVPELLRQGHSVVGVDRNAWTGNPGVEFHHADLLEPAGWEPALEDVDMVMHLAAAKADWGLTAEEYRRDNVEATRVLLERACDAGVGDWFFYSTVATMGPKNEATGEGADFSPRGPYGETKAEAERLLRHRVGGDPSRRLNVLRPSAIFGPGHPDSTNVNRLIRALRSGTFVMVGDGDVVKSTSYMENVVAATLFLMNAAPETVGTYVYVDEPQLTTAELVREICRLLGRPEPRLRIPRPVASALAAPLDVLGDLLHVDFPITRARIEKFCRATRYDSDRIREAGFQQPVDMATALERTVEWHRQEKIEK